MEPHEGPWRPSNESPWKLKVQQCEEPRNEGPWRLKTQQLMKAQQWSPSYEGPPGQVMKAHAVMKAHKAWRPIIGKRTNDGDPPYSMVRWADEVIRDSLETYEYIMHQIPEHSFVQSNLVRSSSIQSVGREDGGCTDPANPISYQG